jgi:hypothetical protein
MEKRSRHALAALFSAVLNDPGLFPRVRETLDGELSSEDSGRPLFEAMAKLWDNDEDPSLKLVLDELGDQPIRSRVAGLMQTLEGEEDLSQRTCEVLDEIKYCRNEQEILKVNGRIRVQQELCAETQPEDIRLQAEETLKSLRGNLMLLLSLRVPGGDRLVDAP